MESGDTLLLRPTALGLLEVASFQGLWEGVAPSSGLSEDTAPASCLQKGVAPSTCLLEGVACSSCLGVGVAPSSGLLECVAPSLEGLTLDSKRCSWKRRRLLSEEGVVTSLSLDRERGDLLGVW